MTCINYMLAHHIVVQYKLIEHCVCTYWKCFSVLFTPRLSFLFLYVLFSTYSDYKLELPSSESPVGMSSLDNYPRSPTSHNKRKLVKDFNLVPNNFTCR